MFARAPPARALMATFILALGCVGCEEKQMQMENVAADNAASAAASKVVRNAGDCTAAKPLIPEAYRQIEEVRGNAKAAASHQILGTLKTQADRRAQLCP